MSFLKLPVQKTLLIFSLFCVGFSEASLAQFQSGRADSVAVLSLVDSSRSVLYQDPNLAFTLADSALDMARHQSYRTGEAKALVAVANSQTVKGKFPAAISGAQQAISIFEEQKQKRMLASALVSLGNAYRGLSNYEQTLEAFYRSLDISREIGLERATGIILGNIGLIYNEMEKYETAERYYREAIEVNSKLENDYALALNYNNMGLLYTSLEQPDSALYYHQKSLSIKEEQGNKIGAAYSLSNMGKVFLEKQEYENAIDYLKQSLELNDGTDADLMAHTYEVMARTLQAMGKLTEAEEYAEMSLNLAIDIGTQLGMQEAYKTLSSIYEQQGSYSQALQHFKDYSAIRDSLMNAEKHQQIAQLETLYELESKQMKISQLELENRYYRMRQFALATGIVLLLLTGFLAGRYMWKKLQASTFLLSIIQKKKQQLSGELEIKKRQLTTQSLNLVQKNETMKELKERVKALKKDSGPREINKLSHMVDYSISLDEDWKQFQLHFEEVHSEFYHELKDRYPELTPNDLKLCAFARLNLSVKEMAGLLGISPDSVKTARHRLRKKLGIKTSENLTAFLLDVEKEAVEKVSGS